MTIQRLRSHPASDGAGVRIQRLHGFTANELDPFLMLDEIHSADPDEYIAGFPAHPHRGMQTLTYMRQGGFMHKDHMGNESALGAGGVQWMSAGRGVIHEEMPLQDEGVMQGFQLWINLPAAEKLLPAQYEDIAPERLTWQPMTGGARLKVLVGEFSCTDRVLQGAKAPLSGSASVADLEMMAGGQASLFIPAEHRLLVFVYQGSVQVQGQDVGRHQALLLEDELELVLESTQGAGLLLLQGQPIAEPMVHHGPFVMNTAAEIRQAVRDYQQGRLTE